MSVANVLEESESADAKTLYAVTKKQLENHCLPLQNMKGLATDGAAVMVGRKSGLGVLLQEDIKDLTTVHCICHRLALVCTDTNVNLKKICQ